MNPLALLQVITTAAPLFGKLAEMMFTDDGYIRSYYFEVNKNLDVLKTIDIKSLKDEEITSPAFQKIITSLETEIGASLLFKDLKKHKKIFNLLNTTLEICGDDKNDLTLETDDDTAEQKSAPKQVTVQVLRAMWFTINKIELLKTLSTLDGTTFRHTFRLNVRLYNIEERLKQIRIQLTQFDAVQQIIHG
ncbi:hypothetical protein FACS189476_03600 [Spirochaetia bacterium]|nr:hypothetical protein FACS189476_03600 [Spirochaetia bacterium]